MQITKGGNAPVDASRTTAALSFDSMPQGLDVDLSAYMLRSDGRTRGDGDMVFYNQPASPDGSVVFDRQSSSFSIDLEKVSPDVERIAICVVVDGGKASSLGAVTLAAGGVTFRHDVSSAPEAAIIVGEVYRRNEAWKVKAVGQGFAGGLAPLARSFGIDVGAEEAPPPPSKVDLRKQKVEQRLVNLEKTAPKLVDLAKKARVSLEKKGADKLPAKVWLVLDVSGSMRPHFRSGAVQTLGERALAYGLNLDDDGRISVLLFDDDAQLFRDVDASNYLTFAQDVQRAPSIWGTTDYGRAMHLLRQKARLEPDFGTVPVYVIFVTDGATENRPMAERQIREASGEGIFWKFMAIGDMPPPSKRTARALPRGFDFLAYLDDMDGRVVDNADFFAVADPAEPTDEEFFDLMANEYATWLEEARRAGVLNG